MPRKETMNIKQLRLSKGMSREMVAYGAGCSAYTVLRLERGERIRPDIEEAIIETIENYKVADLQKA